MTAVVRSESMVENESLIGEKITQIAVAARTEAVTNTERLIKPEKPAWHVA